ncbi:MAG TPA: hypothetical protein VGS12_08190 [Caulobacteraceae bacterium]|nr:hypothetical protein [Caulobacteraceae bacterium]
MNQSENPESGADGGEPGEGQGVSIGAFPLDDPRREAFAQALASGASVAEATREAGYAWRGQGARLVRAPRMMARLAWLAARRSDLPGLIQTAVAIAGEARSLKSAQGYTSARGALEFAARLRAQGAAMTGPAAGVRAAAAALPPNPLDLEISDQEWLARFGPPAPEESPR